MFYLVTVIAKSDSRTNELLSKKAESRGSYDTRSAADIHLDELNATLAKEIDGTVRRSQYDSFIYHITADHGHIHTNISTYVGTEAELKDEIAEAERLSKNVQVA